MINVKKLESQLTNLRFVTLCYGLRKEKKVTLTSAEVAKDFLIKFLVLEAISGINYTDEELSDTFTKIQVLVNNKSEISSKELPYHEKKKRPFRQTTYVVDGCTVLKQ